MWNSFDVTSSQVPTTDNASLPGFLFSMQCNTHCDCGVGFSFRCRVYTSNFVTTNSYEVTDRSVRADQIDDQVRKALLQAVCFEARQGHRQLRQALRRNRCAE